MSVCFALKRNRKIGLLPIMQPQVIKKPLRKVENKERNIKPLKLLLAMYEFVIKNVPINIFLMPRKDETKECDSNNISLRN